MYFQYFLHRSLHRSPIEVEQLSVISVAKSFKMVAMYSETNIPYVNVSLGYGYKDLVPSCYC